MDSSNRYSTMMTTSRFQSGTDSGAATPPAIINSPSKAPLVYGSVAEMKRKTKIKNGTMRAKPCAIPIVGETGSHDLKRFHSTPDLNTHLNGSASSIWAAASKGHHSQDDVAILHTSMQRLNMLPPPTHPPPPPPIGQRSESDAVTSAAIDGIQSSFNPSANAKIYASPQELRNVMAWKLRQSHESRQSQNGKTQQQQNLKTLDAPEAQAEQPTAVKGKALKPISQYAQPTTSHSSLQQPQLQQQTSYDEAQQNGIEVNNTNNNHVGTGPAPPIPEPDYSFSESDGEDENSILVARNTKLNEKITLTEVPETSANSQASGSSSGSASISHSLSVDEIQRVRNNLKQSKSSPNGFLKIENQQSGGDSETQIKSAEVATEDERNNNENNANQGNEINEEEADNSSSGVSSDQEVAGGAIVGKKSKSTDTIKKKPNSKSVEESKTVLVHPKDETTSVHIQAEVRSSSASLRETTKMNTASTMASTNIIEIDLQSTTKTTKPNDENPDTVSTKCIPFTVASTAAVFEAKATTTTVTVKQMVQQQHAPVIQQQQQQQISANKAKTFSSNKHTATALASKSELLATQQHIFLQQQQQNIINNNNNNNNNNIASAAFTTNTKAKAAAAGVTGTNTAAIVTKQQQQLHKNSQHGTENAIYESEYEQRSEDEGDLSPSPPAKGFQRHNS
ncbi:unnamed protein product [Ceratitis capitata]|uniref:(Mediterranean fruit fly) hypothetical protein n=1 Tax=Ceratitis capitata TaxID=7213 RepID=A0A811VDJ1_CERCA|nr:unnamed protein product [Ceratitis capitata]